MAEWNAEAKARLTKAVEYAEGCIDSTPRQIRWLSYGRAEAADDISAALTAATPAGTEMGA